MCKETATRVPRGLFCGSERFRGQPAGDQSPLCTHGAPNRSLVAHPERAFVSRCRTCRGRSLVLSARGTGSAATHPRTRRRARWRVRSGLRRPWPSAFGARIGRCVRWPCRRRSERRVLLLSAWTEVSNRRQDPHLSVCCRHAAASSPVGFRARQFAPPVTILPCDVGPGTVRWGRLGVGQGGDWSGPLLGPT